MKLFVTSDTFFGRTLSAVNGGFESLEAMEDTIIDNWNTKVKKDDIVYHLGNFAWDPIASEASLSYLNGTIFFVPGIYDKSLIENSLIKIGRHKILPHISEIQKVNSVLCHWPLQNWLNKEEGSLHIHGGTRLDDMMPHRFCANIANWNWSPIEFDFLIEMAQTQTK